MSTVTLYDALWFVFLGASAFTVKYGKRIFQNIIKNSAHSGLLTKAEHEIYTKVNNKLVEILIGMHCDRAYVFSFHNGTDLAGKISRKKVSCIFEQVSQGTSREIDKLRDMDVTSIWDWVQCFQAKPSELPQGVKVMKNNPRCDRCALNKRVLHFDVAGLSAGYLKAILVEQGITSMIQTLILDQTGGIMGILGIDYCDSVPTDTFPQCDLCHEADVVALHMSELSRTKVTLWQYIKTLLEK